MKNIKEKLLKFIKSILNITSENLSDEELNEYILLEDEDEEEDDNEY